jgi:hypothetical protein
MTKNSTRIISGITTLVDRPYEIISGTVLSGSVDINANTFSLQPSYEGEPIMGVMLTSVSDDDNGVVLVPKNGSNVIVGSVDGPGQWTLLKANALEKVVVKVGEVNCEISGSGIKLHSGNTMVDIGSLIKIGTASESLFGLLNDLLTAIMALTVTTSTGPSSVPVNLTSFSALSTRLSNLLSA